MNKIRKSFNISVAFLLGLLVANVATLVYAHGGDTSLIHACVRNSNGQLRIVGPNDQCASSESPLDWRIQGEPGPQGPPGESGLSQHYQQLQFTLAANQTYSIPLPVADTPVRLDISTSTIVMDCENGITELLGPMAFGGVFSFDTEFGRNATLLAQSDSEYYSRGECNPAGGVLARAVPDPTTGEVIISIEGSGANHIIAPVDFVVNMWY
jgi:hypothetical protein